MKAIKQNTFFHDVKRFLYTIITSGYGDQVDLKKRSEIILLNIILLAGVAIITPYGISRLFQGLITLGIIDFLAALSLVFLLFYHWIWRRIMLPRFGSILVVTVLFGYLTISTGYNATGLLWSYCLPAVTVFLLGRNIGNLFLLGYVLIILCCFNLPVFACYTIYSSDIKTAFIFSFLTVWIVAYYFEYIMSALHSDQFRNNNELKKALSDLGEAKDQLFHAQKLEAIGRLAGGVAHDFNNILAAISGYSELIKQKSVEDPAINRYAVSIFDSATRAVDLTSKLLAYARKGKNVMEPFDIHQTIRDVVDICNHTMGKNIRIQHHFSATRSTIMGDRNQIHNAIINLAVNANDAMPEGGDMTFSTESFHLSAPSAGYPPDLASPANYLKFCLSDTGMGMDKETLEKAFEPFFTTKDKGRGAGLGLSSAYGTIKSHNGHIALKSTPGKGTLVEIYLPLSDEMAAKVNDGQLEIIKGQGMILFVDDEEMVRNMAADMIKALGYTVVTCKDGQDALEFYQVHHGTIDLVVLDLIMPRMGGYASFKAMKLVNPDLKALASSGYVINNEAKKMLDEGALGFVQKPFTLNKFAKTIQSVINK